MSPSRPCSLLLATALLLSAGPILAAEANKTAEVKRITDRYALNQTRIKALLGLRLHPAPLPGNLPNPFYSIAAELAPAADRPMPNPTDVAPVPAAPDASDIDTLMKYAAGLKISGLVMLNNAPHLTINQTLYKIGDVVLVGTKENPVYLQILAITPQELTLGLNESTYALKLKK